MSFLLKLLLTSFLLFLKVTDDVINDVTDEVIFAEVTDAVINEATDDFIFLLKSQMMSVFC